MKNKKQTLIIIILIILLVLVGAYCILGPNGYKATQKGTEFFDDVMELQSNLSYYVGASYSDAFGVYSKTEILSGITEDGEKIKDNQDNLLPTLIDMESAVDYKNDTKAYKLNMDNLKTTLSVDIGSYEGVTFYVADGDLVKVVLDSRPEWWNDNYNALVLE